MLWQIFQTFTIPGLGEIGGGKISGPLGDSISDLKIGEIIRLILQNIIFPAAAVITFLMLIVSAYQFITSTGDPKAVDSARTRIWMALLGFLIVVFAWFLLRLLEELTLPGPARVTSG